MRRSKSFGTALILQAVSLLALQLNYACEPADARGGGGGGRGGGGGGFRGGFSGGGMRPMGGDRGWGDRDMGDRGWGDRGFGDGGGRGFGDDGRGLGRDAGFDDRPRASESELRAGANQEYHWGNSLPTDGGFARAANQGYGAASRVTQNVSSAGLAARGSNVRNAFNRYDLFNHDFWNRYRDGWWYPGWGDYWPWEYTGWGGLSSFWGYPDDPEPVEYDYGNNITYQDNQVYYGDQPMESAEDYYTGAQTLALSAPPTVPPVLPPTGTKAATKSGAAKKTTEKESDWKPLGVFALTQGDQTDSNTIFQLAVNKTGVVRGNYYNPLTQEEKPVQGKYDRKSKRVAWTIGSNKTVVYDTGIANLLAPQSSILVHLNKDTTQQWNLVRLQHNQNSSS